MKLDDLAGHTGGWLNASAPESGVVISSRARLARNIASFAFSPKLGDDERAEVELRARAAIESAAVAKPGFYVDLFGADSVDRKLLVERRLISREHEDATGQRGVAVRDDESVSIMVNEEDHLRLQTLLPGLAVGEAWRGLDAIDTALEKHLDYAFHPRFGYLTACPTNVGTGLRVSVMLHLPALAITRQLEKVFQAVAKLNLAVRGLYGEGTEATGHFYQVSNQSTLGKSEEDIVRGLEAVVPQVVRYEQAAREALLNKDRSRLEDRTWRAYGMIRHARTVTSNEALALLSALRMGVLLGLVGDVPLDTVNELLLFTQPAHLQKRTGRELDARERDAARGAYLRSRLEEAERN
ncbi:MAG: protein arginine kinase [Planctomycetota bacterium]|jgi:protein arginine kinase